MNRGVIIEKVILERMKQDKKWGIQHHDHLYWKAIVDEEMGEVSKHLIADTRNINLAKEELIQVIASCFAWLEDWEEASKINEDSWKRYELKEVKEVRNV